MFLPSTVGECGQSRSLESVWGYGIAWRKHFSLDHRRFQKRSFPLVGKNWTSSFFTKNGNRENLHMCAKSASQQTSDISTDKAGNFVVAGFVFWWLLRKLVFWKLICFCTKLSFNRSAFLTKLGRKENTSFLIILLKNWWRMRW